MRTGTQKQGCPGDEAGLFPHPPGLHSWVVNPIVKFPGWLRAGLSRGSAFWQGLGWGMSGDWMKAQWGNVDKRRLALLTHSFGSGWGCTQRRMDIPHFKVRVSALRKQRWKRKNLIGPGLGWFYLQTFCCFLSFNFPSAFLQSLLQIRKKKKNKKQT